MKKLIITCVVFFFYNQVALAYELNGSLSNNNDETYSVVLQNQYGHEYQGEADDNGDGTLDVSVQDDNGQTYLGTATLNNDGTYDLDLQNDSSEVQASGTLILDN